MRKNQAKGHLSLLTGAAALIATALVAVFPSLFLYFQNAGEVHFREVSSVSFAFLSAGLVLYGFCLLVTHSAAKAGVIASLFLLIFLNYAPIEGIIQKAIPSLRYWHIAPIFLVLLLHAAWFIKRKLPEELAEIIVSVLALVMGVLILMNGVMAAPAVEYRNDFTMLREEIIRHTVQISGEDPIVSTTGKASRELFETRVTNNQSHQYDFLTVGSMGHSSSIALGVAINKPEQKIWCIDGDGAVLMHMGAMAVVGSMKPKNLVHVVVNNGAHETVGGMPTAAGKIDLVGIAKACGYPHAVCVSDFASLDRELEAAKTRDSLSLIEVKCAIGAREDLGRPTTTALENKQCFMEYLGAV